jgi:hypothetical protein
MHYGTENIEQVRARLVAEGLEPSRILPFQRMVETLDGSAMMRARRLSFAPEENPEALFQIVQHETPELVLQRRYMSHPNGALAISEAILCVDDAAEVSARPLCGPSRRAPRRFVCIILGLARAPRDEVIRQLVGKLHASWKASIVTALEQARTRSLLREDIDVEAAAGLVLGVSWSFVARIFTSTKELEATAELLRSLVRPFATQSRVTRSAKIRR